MTAAIDLDLDALVAKTRKALVFATPDVLAELAFAQLPLLDAEAGLALVERLFATVPHRAWAWQVADERLDRWPAPVADCVLARAKRASRGAMRILVLCQVPRRLSPAERRAAFEGVLDGTLPETVWDAGPPFSYSDLIAGFVRTLPADWQEEWIARRAARPGSPGCSPIVRAIMNEIVAREALGPWTEAAAGALWERIDALPSELRVALWRLPPRPWQVGKPPPELTPEQRLALVDAFQTPYAGSAEPALAEHLWAVAEHLPHIPMEERRRWFRTVQIFQRRHRYYRQLALTALLPALEGQDQSWAAFFAVGDACNTNQWLSGSLEGIDDRSRELMAAIFVLQDKAGHHRDALIDHLTREHPPAAVDECFLRILSRHLPRIPVDRRIETLAALTPWLADRTGGAWPRRLAALDLPLPRKKPDQHVRLRRASAKRRRRARGAPLVLRRYSQ